MSNNATSNIKEQEGEESIGQLRDLLKIEREQKVSMLNLKLCDSYHM